MKTISRATAFQFWNREIAQNNADYIDECGEYNTTMMGEMAAEYFDVMSEMGDTEIEQNIFDWATEYAEIYAILN